MVFVETQISSPLGPLRGIADEKALCLLDFVERVHKPLPSSLKLGRNALLDSIERELELYFAGKLQRFTTPLALGGTSFQQEVWRALMDIPFGQTRSYAQQAKAIGRPTAFRAVAQANGRNRFAIIIPCHRVINSNGQLGGYGGGLERKEWLLQHERRS